MKLVEVKQPEFDVVNDIRYATENNFTGSPVYKKPGSYLHYEAAEALKKAIELAARDGLRLKIFDAYRPLEAQQTLWQHTPDPEFLSDPDGGSCPHCRGVAVDLSFVDADGKELDMGTGFDDFSRLSHHGNMEISPTAQKNRGHLKQLMLNAGWDFYKNEWWHYQLFNCRDYDLLTDKEAGTGMI